MTFLLNGMFIRPALFVPDLVVVLGQRICMLDLSSRLKVVTCLLGANKLMPSR